MLRQGRLGVPSSHTQDPVHLLGLCGFPPGVRSPRGFTVSGFIIKTKDDERLQFGILSSLSLDPLAFSLNRVCGSS